MIIVAYCLLTSLSHIPRCLDIGSQMIKALEKEIEKNPIIPSIIRHWASLLPAREMARS